MGVDIAYIAYIHKSGEKKKDNPKANTMDDTLLCLTFGAFSDRKMRVCSDNQGSDNLPIMFGKGKSKSD